MDDMDWVNLGVSDSDEEYVAKFQHHFGIDLSPGFG
jgi:hypothetical protein